MSHHCHAYGCDVSTPPRLFMCRKHWAMVPKAMQDRIYETCTHRPGDLANVSQAYLDAARTARLFVRDLGLTVVAGVSPDPKGETQCDFD